MTDNVTLTKYDALKRRRAGLENQVRTMRETLVKLEQASPNLQRMYTILGRRDAPAIPDDLHQEIMTALLTFDYLNSNDALRALFVRADLAPWASSVREANTQQLRASGVVAGLYPHYTRAGDNVLVSFLQTLRDTCDPKDARHPLLDELAKRLAAIIAQEADAIIADQRAGLAEREEELSDVESQLLRIERQLKHQLRILAELILKHFGEQELQLLAIAFHGQESFDRPLTPDRVQRWVEHLYYRGKLSHLKTYIRHYKPDMDVSSLSFPDTKPAKIDFVNRADEIQRVMSSFSPPYMLINAPSGYGKTELLRTVSDEFAAQGWLCLNVALRREEAATYDLDQLTGAILAKVAEHCDRELRECAGTSPSDLCVHLVNCLGDCADETMGIILIIDNAELLDQEVAKTLMYEIAPVVYSGLTHDMRYAYPVKFVLSGRYIADWTQLSDDATWVELLLPPFSFDVVQQMVERFALLMRRKLSSDVKLKLAAHLTHHTGGHPGCMASVLQDPQIGPMPDLYFNQKGSARIYATIVEPLIAHVRRGIPDDLLPIFDTLSVIRRFDRRLLAYLMGTASPLIVWPSEVMQLEDALTKTYLVGRDQSFLHDGVVRRLLAIRARRVDLNRYLAISRRAFDFYMDCLKDPPVFRPDILAVEAVYQIIQQAYDPETRDHTSCLARLSDVLEALVAHQPAPIRVVDGFKDLLYRDWEVRFDLNYLCGKGGYDDAPYREMQEVVERFYSSL